MKNLFIIIYHIKIEIISYLYKCMKRNLVSQFDSNTFDSNFLDVTQCKEWQELTPFCCLLVCF